MHIYSQQKASSRPASATNIQTRLKIGQPNDAYEREADRVADRVLSESPVAKQGLGSASPQIQNKCKACAAEEKVQKTGEDEEVQAKPMGLIQREEKEALQMKPEGGNPTASAAVSNQILQSRGTGNPMPLPIRQQMESSIGADFSRVNIHTDASAVQMSQQLNARAFTVGNDIYFNKGQYSPGSKSGQHLLAHELTHTVQQGKSPEKRIQRELVINNDATITKYGFTAGQEAPLAFMQLAQRLSADGLISSNDLYELRAWGINNMGTLTDGMRLLMAGLLDANNLTLFNGLNLQAGTRFEFPMASITSANRDRVANLNREVDTSHIDQLTMEIGDAYNEGGIPAMADKMDERDQAIEAQIITLAGSYVIQIRQVITYANANKVDLEELMNAMINAASESTAGDRYLAGFSYAVSKAAGLAKASDIESGNIKVDALTPSAFNTVFAQAAALGAEAIYSPSAWQTGEVKGDTMYLKDNIDIQNVTSRSTIVHEMTHATDDAALGQGGAVQNTSVRDLEFTAYTAQARYVLGQIANAQAADRARYIQETGAAWNDIFNLALLFETKANEAAFKPVMIDLLAAYEPDPAGNNAQKATRLLGYTSANIKTAMLAAIDRLYNLSPGDTSRLDGLSGESSLDWVGRI